MMIWHFGRTTLCVLAVLAACLATGHGAEPSQNTQVDDFNAKLLEAKQVEKPVLLYLVNEGGGASKRFESEIMANGDIKNALAQYVLARISIDSAQGQVVKSAYGWARAPFLAVLNRDGEAFNVIDFSTVNAALINAEMVTHVKAWLEKSAGRFVRNKGTGYAQGELASDDPIRAIISKWTHKEAEYKKQPMALLLDAAKVDVAGDGSATHRLHIIEYVGKDAGRPIHDWSDTLTKNMTFKLVRARTITPDLKQRPVEPQDLEEAPLYTNYPELATYRRVSVLFPGAKQGCYLEIEYELSVTPQMPGHFSFVWGIESQNILSLDSQLEVNIPGALDLRHKVVRNGVPPQVETLGQSTRFTWKGASEHLRPRSDDEVQAPVSGYIVLASRATWEGIGKWFLSLCDSAREQPPALAGWVSNIVRNVVPGEKYEKRVTTGLLRAMRQEFRYLAVGIDASGYQPHPVTATFQNKFGDCKDFAVFLQECLKHAHIASELVLLRAGSLDLIDEEIPRVPYFTHCILKVKSAEGDFYVDPTALDYAAGLIPPGDCSVAGLLCAPEGIRLVNLPDVAEGSRSLIEADFSNIANDSVKARLVIRSVGAAKEPLRHLTSTVSSEALKRIPQLLFPKVFENFSVTRSDTSGEQVNADAYEMTFEGTAVKPFTSAGNLLVLPGFLPYATHDVGLPNYLTPGREEKNHGLFTGLRIAPTTQQISYAIPDALTPKELPRPFHVDTPYFRVDREVESGKRKITIRTTVGVKFVPGEPRFVRTSELPVEARGIRDLMAQPLVLQRGTSGLFLDACRKGDLPQVTSLLEGGADLEGPDDGGYTPLMVAARAGKNDVVKYLIGKGCKVNARNPGDQAALFLACNNGKADVALTLIAAGADCSTPTKKGYTPLMAAACSTNEIEVLKLILSKGVDVNANSDDGPAIIKASENNNLEAIRLLAKAGANLHLVASEKDFGKKFRFPALALAARDGKIETLKALLAAGFDINHPAREGSTALMLAVGFNQLKSVQALLDAGARVDIQAQDGQTALMRALLFSKDDIIKCLIDRKAGLNIKDGTGKTALMIAARKKKRDAARMLVEAGADVNAVDAQGETALTMAGDVGDMEAVEYFKKCGATKTGVHVIPWEKRPAPLSPARAWAVALTAVYRQVHHEDVQYVGGAAEPDADGVKNALKVWWDIKNKTDLMNTMGDLKDLGHHAKYKANGKQVAGMTEEAFRQFITGPTVNPNRVEGIKLLRECFLKWGDRTGLAWDWVRYVWLAGAGVNTGYLSEAEAFDLIMPIARQTQKTFTSWKEMGECYIDGRAVWAGKRDPYFEACYRLLVNEQDPNSPWNNLPWGCDLSGAK